MKTVAIEDPELTVRELVEMAQSEPVILTREGAAVAGVLGVDEADAEAWSLGSNPEFIAMIERFRERGRREGAVPLEELRQRWGVPEPAPADDGAAGTGDRAAA